jgi:hypothetical protein
MVSCGFVLKCCVQAVFEAQGLELVDLKPLEEKDGQ